MSKDQDQDTIRVIRILSYTGPRDVVERHLKGVVQGTKMFEQHYRDGPKGSIQLDAVTLGEFPEIMSTTNLPSPAPEGYKAQDSSLRLKAMVDLKSTY